MRQSIFIHLDVIKHTKNKKDKNEVLSTEYCSMSCVQNEKLGIFFNRKLTDINEKFVKILCKRRDLNLQMNVE